MQKICIRCNQTKDIDLFAKGSKYKDGRRNVCKRCHTDYMLTYYQNNDEQRKTKNRINSSKDFNWKRHHLSKEKFDQLVDRFNGKCYTCKTNEATNIDHDHSCCSGNRSCGECVRGILCNQCNTALGLVKDSKKTLLEMIQYLGT